MRDIEMCCNCNSPTGKAGRGDDSIYCECGDGPFCLDCYHALLQEQSLVEDFGGDVERLRRDLDALRNLACVRLVNDFGGDVDKLRELVDAVGNWVEDYPEGYVRNSTEQRLWNAYNTLRGEEESDE